MSFKINENHWLVLIEFMEKHPSFARGQFSGPAGKSSHRKLWDELSHKLNSLGYGSRPTEKWQKTWADIKYMIKKKSATFAMEQNKTGGGVGVAIKLNTYEERILAILGKSFSEGVGSSECGIILNKPSNEPSTSSGISRGTYSHFEVPAACSKEQDFEDTEFLESVQETEQDVVIQHEKPIKVSVGTMEKDVVMSEHGYSVTTKTTKKRKIEDDTDHDLYVETIKELQLIRTGVNKIGQNLSEMNDTLKEIKNAFLHDK